MHALWILLSLLVAVRAQYSCHKAASCTLADFYSVDTFLECYGYSSCQNAVRLISTPGIQCYGAFSCYEADLIQTTTGVIECFGLFSCANAQLISATSSSAQLLCHGEQACAGSNIVTAGSNSAIAYGFRSLAFSSVTETGTASVSVYGALGAQDTIFQAGANTVTFHFDAHDSGHGVQIVSSSTCNMYCYSSACNNVDISGASVNIYCNDAMKSSICPDGYELPTGFVLPSLAEYNFTTFQNSFQTCTGSNNSSDTDALNCGDYDTTSSAKCYDQSFLSTDNKNSSAICCTAYESCKLTENITASIDESSSKTSFRADGYLSADATGLIKTVNGGDIYFTGYGANSGFSVLTDIVGNDLYDIIVTGYRAIRYKTIDYVKNTYCLAYGACNYASINNVKGNVYGYARSALEEADINNVNGDIYCDGYYACRFIDVSNATGNIIGIGTQIMYFATMEAVAGAVVAYGYKALYSAEISDTSEVIADGFEVLRNSKIDGVDRIEATGENCLSNSVLNDVGTVIADGEKSLVEAKINGVRRIEATGSYIDTLTNASVVTNLEPGDVFTGIFNQGYTDKDHGYEVYCSYENICRISCNSHRSCRQMRLYCNGTCIVQCYERFAGYFDCPDVVLGDFEDWITEEPSTEPSEQPTITQTNGPTDIPSEIPSSIPTILPSTIPSNLPSYMPSIMPSDMPSTVPSKLPSTRPSSMPSTTPTSIPSVQQTDFPTSFPTILGVVETTDNVVSSSSIPSEYLSGYPSRFPGATRLPGTSESSESSESPDSSAFESTQTSMQLSTEFASSQTQSEYGHRMSSSSADVPEAVFSTDFETDSMMSSSSTRDESVDLEFTTALPSISPSNLVDASGSKSDGDEMSGLDTGVIIGIVFAVLLVGVVLACVYQRARKRGQEDVESIKQIHPIELRHVPTQSAGEGFSPSTGDLAPPTSVQE